MFLSSEDLEALTGWKRPKEQIKFLKDQAIPHLINAAGKPVVLRSVIDKRLGGDTDGIDTHVDMEQFERNLWTLNNGFKNKDATLELVTGLRHASQNWSAGLPARRSAPTMAGKTPTSSKRIGRR